jgi:putative ABC transport system permease protein
VNPPVLLKIALRNVLKNRLRAFLTMLGIIIGVAAVVIMVSIGQGAQTKVESQIASMGTNLLTVFPGSGRFGGARQTINKMTLEDADRIRDQCSAVDKTSAVVRSGSQIVAGTSNCNTSVMGVSPQYFQIRSWSLTHGSVFGERDVKANAKVVILGRSVADNLFGQANPVGRRVRIGNVPFKVVGVLAEKGSSPGPGGDQDDAAYAPVTTVLNRLSGARHIDMVLVGARSPETMDQAQSQVAALLRQRHNIHAKESDDFSIMNQTEIIQMAAQTTGVFTLLLASIAGVSLIVGGIGIMNIMLVSVTERTREIGIRLAVGAHESDILIQFVVEAVVLSMIGGLIGIAAGIGISMLLNLVFRLSTTISPLVAAVSFLFSGAVGVFFGFYPARRASTMNPIEALRYE